MATNQWWVYLNDDVRGPYTEEELAERNDLTPETLVCPDGTEDWNPIADHPDLVRALDLQPARPPQVDPTGGHSAKAPTPRIGPCLSRGWTVFKNNLTLWLGLAVLYLVLVGVAEGTGFLIGEQLGGLVLLFWQIFTSLLYGLFYLGILKITLDLLEGRSADPYDLVRHTRWLIPYFVASVLFGLLIGIGFVFLLLPGFYLLARFMFYAPAMVDRDVGIIESLSTSWNLTAGFNTTLYTLGFVIVLGVLNLVGGLLFGLGLLVTGPVSQLAYVEYYRGLNQSSSRYSDPSDETPSPDDELGPTLQTG